MPPPEFQHSSGRRLAQSLNQLAEKYGPNHSILDNCHVRITYASNDPTRANRIRDMLGTASLVREQVSKSRGKGLASNVQVTRSYQEYGRPLLTPDEIQTLEYSDALLMVGNAHPYRAKKVIVYDDPRFAGRLQRLSVMLSTSRLTSFCV